MTVCLKDQEACQVILQQKEQALRDACALGNIETTQKLLTEGVNPNSTDLQGRTAFHYTVMREELVREKIQQQVLQKNKKKTIDEHNIQIATSTAMSNHAAIAALLLANQANPKLNNSQGNNAIDLIRRDRQSSNPLDKQTADTLAVALESFIQNDEQALRLTCALGECTIVKSLLDKWVDPNAVDELKRSTLHYAVSRGNLVKKFYKKRTLLSEDITTEQLEIVMDAHSKIVSELLARKADPFLKNQSNNTCIDIVMRDIDSANTLDNKTACAIQSIFLANGLLNQDMIEKMNFNPSSLEMRQSV